MKEQQPNRDEADRLRLVTVDIFQSNNCQEKAIALLDTAGARVA